MHGTANASLNGPGEVGFQPWRWAAWTALLCTVPLVLMTVGVEFSTRMTPFTPETTGGLSASQLVDAAHMGLRGNYTHTLLEWTAVCVAAFVGILAFVQFRLTRKPSLPIIGMTMVCAGAMDAFHTFAADRLIQAVADNRDLIPFTWAICRLFNSIIMLVGVGIFAYSSTRHRLKQNSVFMVGISASLIVAAYIIIHFCATSNILPQTMFSGSTVKRPYDLAPLIPYLLCAAIVYPQYYKRYPTIFSYALLLSLIPDVATQLYMALGSFRLHDSCFNVAHALKAVSYMVPALGLIIEYVHTYRKHKRAQRARLFGLNCPSRDHGKHRRSRINRMSRSPSIATEVVKGIRTDNPGRPIAAPPQASMDDAAHGKPPTQPQQRVLLVDDSKSILAALARLLRREPYEVVTVPGGKEALQLMETETFQLVVSDQCMPSMTGLDLLREVRRRWPDTIRIMLSGYTEVKIILAAINEGAIFRFITKPWNDEELKLNIVCALEQHDREAMNSRMAERIAEQDERLRELNRRPEYRAEGSEASLLRALLDAVGVCVLAVDKEGVVVSAKARARKRLSSNNGELAGIPAQLVLPSELRAALSATMLAECNENTGRLQLQGRSCQFRVTSLGAEGVAQGYALAIWENVS